MFSKSECHVIFLQIEWVDKGGVNSKSNFGHPMKKD